MKLSAAADVQFIPWHRRLPTTASPRASCNSRNLERSARTAGIGTTAFPVRRPMQLAIALATIRPLAGVGDG